MFRIIFFNIKRFDVRREENVRFGFKDKGEEKNKK